MSSSPDRPAAQYGVAFIVQEAALDLANLPGFPSGNTLLSERACLAVSPAGVLYVWDVISGSAPVYPGGLLVENHRVRGRAVLAFHSASLSAESWATIASFRFLVGAVYLRICRLQDCQDQPNFDKEDQSKLDKWMRRRWARHLVVVQEDDTGIVGRLRTKAPEPETPHARLYLDPQFITTSQPEVLGMLAGPEVTRKILVLPPTPIGADGPADQEADVDPFDQEAEAFRADLIPRCRESTPDWKPEGLDLLEATAEPLVSEFIREGGRIGFADHPSGDGRRMDMVPAQGEAAEYRRRFLNESEDDFFDESAPPWMQELRESILRRLRAYLKSEQLSILPVEQTPTRCLLPLDLFRFRRMAQTWPGEFIDGVQSNAQMPEWPSDSLFSLDKGTPAVALTAWVFAAVLWLAV